MNRARTALIIPCHNEEMNIRSVIEGVNAVMPEGCIVVVNDGSTDRTQEIIESCQKQYSRIVLLNLPINLGIGGAVQTGFRYAALHDFDFAVKIDGDGQHPAGELLRLLEPLKKEAADMVIGSRFLNRRGFQSTQIRRVGIWFFRFLISFLIGQRITDNTSGFRAYNRKAILFAAEHYPAFDYPEPEEVVLMARNGFRILEIPVEMQERQGGISSINLKRSIYYMMKVTTSVMMAAIRPRERRF